MMFFTMGFNFLPKKTHRTTKTRTRTRKTKKTRKQRGGYTYPDSNKTLGIDIVQNSMHKSRRRHYS
jgi:hypothetical protein